MFCVLSYPRDHDSTHVTGALPLHPELMPVGACLGGLLLLTSPNSQDIRAAPLLSPPVPSSLAYAPCRGAGAGPELYWGALAELKGLT